MTSRRGASRLGCLFTALVLVTIVYFGVNIGEVYFRYFRLRDAMMQEVRFADTRSDAGIRIRLDAVADSIGIPQSRESFRIERSPARIVLHTEYTERVELPLFARDFRFTPRVERVR